MSTHLPKAYDCKELEDVHFLVFCHLDLDFVHGALNLKGIKSKISLPNLLGGGGGGVSLLGLQLKCYSIPLWSLTASPRRLFPPASTTGEGRLSSLSSVVEDSPWHPSEIVHRENNTRKTPSNLAILGTNESVLHTGYVASFRYYV